MPGKTWCSWSFKTTDECEDHGRGHPHTDIPSPLGPDDEPRRNGALVVAWRGIYRRMEVWVASGANVGNWYCLGNEFGRPKICDPEPAPVIVLLRHGPKPTCPPHMIPLQPDWYDVLKRGPITLLSGSGQERYADGWRNGRRNLAEQIESLAEDDAGAYQGADS